MSVTPKNRLGALRLLGSAIALIIMTFVAIRLTGNSGEAKPQAALENTVGTAPAISSASANADE